jgi:hypothetical protein
MAMRARRGVDTWGAIRAMISPELARFRVRYPRSRRRAILEAMAKAADDENANALIAAGTEYFALTAVVPPGCYAQCQTREPRYFLAGQRVNRRRRSEAWSLHPYHYQVWR